MNNLIPTGRIDNSLRDFFFVMFRQKRKAVWVFLGLMGIALLVTIMMPRLYKSEAKLLVRLGRENASIDPTVTASGQVVAVEQRRENEMKSELEILRSRDLAEKVVDQIGPERILGKSWFSFFRSPDKSEQRRAAVKKIMSNWSISSEKDSNIISIAYQAPSREMAHDVVASLMNAYLEKHLLVNRTHGSYDFFKEQTDKASVQLKTIENHLADLKNQAFLASLDDQRRIIQERASAVQRDLEQTNADYKVTQTKIGVIKEQLSRLPETIVTSNTTGFPNTAADGMRQKLYELQLKEQDLLSKFTEKNFLVQETRRQIRDAEALYKREPSTRAQLTRGLNAVHEQAKMSLAAEQANNAALQTRAQALSVILASVNSELRDFNVKETQIAQLQREREILDASYREYSKKMEQARIDTALETEKISNISVAQAATHPIDHSSPRTGLNLALGCLLGTFGAVGMAYWAEGSDQSFRRIEDVEARLHMPLLAAVPLLNGNRNGLPSQAQGMLPAAGSLDASGAVEGTEECCFEILAHRLLANNGEWTDSKVIGVISCYSGEGVSSVASRLAQCLAGRTNERVLFVEANLVTPSAHTRFGIQDTPGLTEVMARKSDFSASIQCSNCSNLEIITAGQGGLTVSQLADSKEFSELLQVVRGEYSSVIIDLPPVFKSISALRLASQLDGIILVVGAEGVSWKVAQEAKDLLTQAKTKVMGVVLNKQQNHIPDWLNQTL